MINFTLLKNKKNMTIKKKGIVQRQIDWIRLKLKRAENDGFTNEDKDQILSKSKSLVVNENKKNLDDNNRI